MNNQNPATVNEILDPKTVFLPVDIVNTLRLHDVALKQVFDLPKMFELFGVYGVAYFVYANYIYNSGTSNFLKHELIHDFTKIDLMDIYRDQLPANPHLEESYTNLVKRLDVMKLENKPLVEAYVKTAPDDITDNVVYYVPMLLSLGDSAYGIRLVAVTGVADNSKDIDICNAIVANLGVLSNSYETTQLVQLPYFKQYVTYC